MGAGPRGRGRRKKMSEPGVILCQQAAAPGLCSLWSKLSCGVVEGHEDPVRGRCPPETLYSKSLFSSREET